MPSAGFRYKHLFTLDDLLADVGIRPPSLRPGDTRQRQRANDTELGAPTSTTPPRIIATHFGLEAGEAER
jgi:hypothetical protein